MTSPLLFADRPDDINRVRDAFQVAGFDAARVQDAIGPEGLSFIGQGELAPILRRTQGGSPLETLIRLFLCGVPVPRSDAERALAPLEVGAWAAAELVAVDGDDVVGLLKLHPLAPAGRTWIVPYDSTRRTDHRADYVIGIGGASQTLAGMTVRPRVARCLDIGTGSGIQALHASTHSGRVVGTDRNARAVAFASFTMALNSVDNVEARQGDLFDPVADEQFGLIVANPPFVISPADSYQYRDSGLPGDEICRRIVAAAPSHLEEGGWCQLLANWAHLKGRDWRERLAGWFDGSGCDVWVIQRDVQDVESYASTWIRHDETDPGRVGEAFNTWMDHYARSGTEAVGFGMITMRRSVGTTPWLRVEELTQDFSLPCGDAIATTFGRLSWLAQAGGDDRELLATTLTVHPDVRLDEHRRPVDGRWELDEATLRLTSGLLHRGATDLNSAGLVAACDGTAPLGVVVHRLAEAVDARPEAITPLVLPIVRRLIEQGFLAPPVGP